MLSILLYVSNNIVLFACSSIKLTVQKESVASTLIMMVHLSYGCIYNCRDLEAK